MRAAVLLRPGVIELQDLPRPEPPPGGIVVRVRTALTDGTDFKAYRRGHPVLAICNVVGSTIAREAHGGIYLHAGPEIGVASTKAFTSQVTVLTLMSGDVPSALGSALPSSTSGMPLLSASPPSLAMAC